MQEVARPAPEPAALERHVEALLRQRLARRRIGLVRVELRRVDHDELRRDAGRLIGQAAHRDGDHAAAADPAEDFRHLAGGGPERVEVIPGDLRQAPERLLARLGAHAPHHQDRKARPHRLAVPRREERQSGHAVTQDKLLAAGAADERHAERRGGVLRQKGGNQGPELARGRRFEQHGGLQLQVEACLHREYKAFRHQGIAADIEEVVVGADGGDLKLMGIKAGDGGSDAVSRAESSPGMLRHRQSPRKSASINRPAGGGKAHAALVAAPAGLAVAVGEAFCGADFARPSALPGISPTRREIGSSNAGGWLISPRCGGDVRQDRGEQARRHLIRNCNASPAGRSRRGWSRPMRMRATALPFLLQPLVQPTLG